MGKLIVSMNLTIDGYLAGANGELDWHCCHWTSDMSDTFCNNMACAGAILLGRKTYEAMMAYWSAKIKDPFCDPDEYAFAVIIDTYPKIVFSNTLGRVKWKNTRLLSGLPEEQISLLKNSSDKNIVVYGSGQLVDALIRANLADEYQLWLHPVVLGSGKQLFSAPHERSLELVKSETFSSGVILLYYRPVASRIRAAI